MKKPANDNAVHSTFDDFHRLRERGAKPFGGFLRRSPSITACDVTAELMGDPPPGRSALDRRRKERA